MKIKHTKKTYEYPTTMVCVNIDDKDRLKKMVKDRGMTMKGLFNKIMDQYENTGDRSIL